MPDSPALGLVCITVGPEVRFRTVTRTRYLSFPEAERSGRLEELYRDNVSRLSAAADFCHSQGIRLYRMSAALFPMSDLPGDDTGLELLSRLAPELRAAGQRFRDADVRVLIHPDQFIVLSSERPEVVASGLHALGVHGRVMDLLGLERSPWSAIILHGGKGGRAGPLAQTILALPEALRSRLALENDEHAYGPEDLLPVCRATGVPLVFDAHHHVVRAGLESQDAPGVREWVLAARATWTPPEWQVVHLSNGVDGPRDRRHSLLIQDFPDAYRDVPWIEVEAKGKEEAIRALRTGGVPGPR